ncbi:hypothetical protein BH23BAC1_BH23BAC1_33930 [soil metagenome]
MPTFYLKFSFFIGLLILFSTSLFAQDIKKSDSQNVEKVEQKEQNHKPLSISENNSNSENNSGKPKSSEKAISSSEDKRSKKADNRAKKVRLESNFQAEQSRRSIEDYLEDF